jgi:hypothetical protein
MLTGGREGAADFDAELSAAAVCTAILFAILPTVWG